MQAVIIDSSVPHGRLLSTTMAPPTPGPGEVLIKVGACGVNRPDILQRRGLYDPPPDASPLPGLEVAGTIVEVGPHVEPALINRPVCALVPGGGYAEYVCCPHTHTLPIPQGLGPIEAASLPETVLTVWSNVFDRGGFRTGHSVLIHGGNSGIGSTALQMVNAMGGHSIVTVRTAHKADFCQHLGARHVINTEQEPDFASQVKTCTKGAGANIILDMLGQQTLDQNLACLALDGVLVQIAFLTGSRVKLDLLPLMVKRQTITGSTLRPRDHAYKSKIITEVHQAIWPHISAGRIKPVIDRCFRLDQAQQAHDYMDSGNLNGKIVLTIS